MDQIEQLGQALAMIFSKLYGFISKGRVPERIEMTNQALKSELDLDIDELSSIPTESFVTTLKEEKRFNYDNLERLADILLIIADEFNTINPENEKSHNLYGKCLEIYNYLNENDLTYSFDRQAKVERIRGILS
jgi:hypothetical protein